MMLKAEQQKELQRSLLIDPKERAQRPQIRHILSFESAEKLIHAFVSSGLDYCDSLYSDADG